MRISSVLRWCSSGLAIAVAATTDCASSGTCEAPASAALEYDSIEGQQLPHPVGRVVGHYAASYRANFPNEDRWNVHVVATDGVLAAVMDGHGGWQVAEFVQTHLVNNTRRALQSAAPAQALAQAFYDTDTQLKAHLRPSLELGFGVVNRVGACGLLAYTHDDVLYIANAGDVRAVLGRVGTKGTVRATPLSRDHNAKYAREQEKLLEAHPGEDDIVVCRSQDACYVKGGLQPTRAFGDFVFKDATFNGSPYPERRGGGRYMAPPYTPPYISSVPEVHVHNLTAADKFLVLGSDGVWDFVTNQQAVDLVQHYVSIGEHALASQGLVHHVISRAAAEYRQTIDALAALPPGRDRRRHHDDTTVVILFFC
ncbi:hypothetical protein SDRG_13901 [Saprolegnia diclina VS20]|uniref:PPM-type phosphatase domain-containing protein n=1 Tax=Saprolegnia diclina (strain VS20) TaxID=1156394 RepID=T0PS86_SAPDV|nr:hypothetical protein SDRG_13901 [Saprolegnia diclina VS20]EQC28354.1 hypothetical protein SDRG_13901 [Saprolegnia diclina VS20]|eukprot:XP_008618224.1 hypothetical protein SDRG_13901 [Saprolegnia diclina VS20]